MTPAPQYPTYIPKPSPVAAPADATYAGGFPTRPLTMLGVWAHPDDESYLSAVLMSRIVKVGGRVVLASATRGEGGGSGDPAELAMCRENELRTAMANLCVRDVRFLGYGDGQCTDADAEQAVHSIIALIEDVRPDVIVTFGPDGITGHPDHVAVSRWTTAAALAAGHERLLYATMTDEFVRRHDALHSTLGVWMAGDGPSSIAATDLALHVVPTTREREMKQRALRSHESQIGPLIGIIGDDAFDDWWVDEFFRRPTAVEWSVDPTSTTGQMLVML
ncbi:MAG: PIG-L family deacetylase [Ilumatobacteraceae bacterium]